MDQRNYTGDFKLAESVIANGLRRLGGEAPAPVSWVESIGDFQFIVVIHVLQKKAAESDYARFLAGDDRELRRQIGASPCQNSFKQSRTLFP